MKNILCFGDSNTHGARPDAPGRYERHERWTGLLQQALGEGYYVIEEGLNGRTTVFDDPVEIDKSGWKHLPSLLKSHAPLDLVVIMLGTNDLKVRFAATPLDISQGAEQLVKLALASDAGRDFRAPRVLLCSPIALMEETFIGEMFGNRRADSLRLGDLYRDVAQRNGVEYLRVSDFAGPSPVDGLHLDLDGHRKVAEAMRSAIVGLLA